MTTPRKALSGGMHEVIRKLLYLTDDSAVAIHCAAHGFKVTPADVARVRASQPGRRRELRAGHYLPSGMMRGDLGMGELAQRRAAAEAASAALLARLRLVHPGIVG